MTVSSPCYNNDHERCIENALQQAEIICKQRRVKFTPMRKRVLNLIWQSHKPLGAYDILSTITAQDERLAAPPTVYRALEFLLDNNLIHRLNSCNAYIGCSHPNHKHQGYFFICCNCKIVIEQDKTIINQAIKSVASSISFHIQQQTVEIIGLCNQCQTNHEQSTY